MADVQVRWARNTAEALGDEGHKWSDVEVVEDGSDVIELVRGDQTVARFGRHDVDVLLVDE